MGGKPGRKPVGQGAPTRAFQGALTMRQTLRLHRYQELGLVSVNASDFVRQAVDDAFDALVERVLRELHLDAVLGEESPELEKALDN